MCGFRAARIIQSFRKQDEAQHEVHFDVDYPARQYQSRYRTVFESRGQATRGRQDVRPVVRNGWKGLRRLRSDGRPYINGMLSGLTCSTSLLRRASKMRRLGRFWPDWPSAEIAGIEKGPLCSGPLPVKFVFGMEMPALARGSLDFSTRSLNADKYRK